jgi:hypothetical protein
MSGYLKRRRYTVAYIEAHRGVGTWVGVFDRRSSV